MSPKQKEFFTTHKDIIGKDVTIIVGKTAKGTDIRISLDNNILYLTAYIKSIIANKNQKLDYYEKLWKKLWHAGKIRTEWDGDSVMWSLRYLKDKNFCEYPQWAPK